MRKGKIETVSLLCLFLCSTFAFAQHPPFWSEIQDFKHQDSISAPSKNTILFVGSSSFRMWSGIHNDFPNHVIINRGFGGSSFPDVIRYADDVIFPYQPKQVVIYCGDNDLASSDSITAKIVFDRFVKLFEMIRKKNEKTNVAFVSIKPSPSRQKLIPKVKEANRMIEAYLKTKSNTSFINVYALMIDAEGQPLKELFREDMLHMKPNGYAIWKKAIEPYLLK
ncbi:MAG: SGNH/GDSL hydrolase family protein [Chryseolinea sp.]